MPEARESDGGLGGFIRRSGYLRKWLILGIAIGIIAGLGAVVFVCRHEPGLRRRDKPEKREDAGGPGARGRTEFVPSGAAWRHSSASPNGMNSVTPPLSDPSSF